MLIMLSTQRDWVYSERLGLLREIGSTQRDWVYSERLGLLREIESTQRDWNQLPRTPEGLLDSRR
jgi:hypothetical protein